MVGGTVADIWRSHESVVSVLLYFSCSKCLGEVYRWQFILSPLSVGLASDL